VSDAGDWAWAARVRVRKQGADGDTGRHQQRNHSGNGNSYVMASGQAVPGFFGGSLGRRGWRAGRHVDAGRCVHLAQARAGLLDRGALARVAFQQSRDGGCEAGVAERNRDVVENDGAQCGAGAGAVERAAPVGGVEESRAERPQVSCRHDRGAVEQFRCYVGLCAHDPATGQPGVPGNVSDTEVGQLGLVPSRDHDVVRLDVPVHDAERVRGGQDVEHLQAVTGHPRGGQRAVARDQLTEGRAVDELHDEVGGAVRGGGRDDLVEGDGVGMLDPRGAASLLEDTPLVGLQFRAAESRWRPQFLDRHLAAEQLVSGEPDRAHPAVAELSHH